MTTYTFCITLSCFVVSYIILPFNEFYYTTFYWVETLSSRLNFLSYLFSNMNDNNRRKFFPLNDALACKIFIYKQRDVKIILVT